MALPKSRKGGSQQGERLMDMSGEPASGLSGILEMSLADECQDEIVERSHDFSHLANGHARGIFFEGDIATIMQTGFNAPVSTADVQ